MSVDPFLVSSNPSDDSITFQVNSDIQLFFDENVTAGSGNIIISNGSDNRTIDINDTSQVTFSKGNVLINPTADLIPNTSYNIQMASGVITDIAENMYAGISDPSTLNFTTIPTDPLLDFSIPFDDSTFQIDNDITLFFDEGVTAGGGDIVISNGTDTRTIDINDTSQVIFDGFNSVTINPAADLMPNTTYNIQMASGVITDIAGNAYAGISDPTTLNFTTIPTDPLLDFSDPSDNSTFNIDNDIRLFFNENVTAGNGDIVISNSTDTRTIDINDTSQITFSKDSVTVNPVDDLIPNTSYSIQLASGVITDIAGNAYAGISYPTTLNFTTTSPEQIVQTIYLGVLGRAAVPSERSFWTERIDTIPPELLTDILLNSAEFVNSFSGQSDEAFVRALHFNLFDRNINQPEIDDWVARIEAEALDPGAILRAVLDEAREADIEAYQAKLAIVDYVTDQTEAGGYVPDTLTVPELRSNAELYGELFMLDMEYDTLDLEQIGSSIAGNPLYAANVGTGETELVIITQQHGDEPTGTEGALLFLDWMSGETAGAAEAREALSVTMVPRVNPDGYARWEQEVGGERGLVDPRRNEAEVDLNRAYDPENPVNSLLSPESEAVIDLIADRDPVLVLDYHNQNLYRADDGSIDTMSVLWATNADVDPALTETGQKAAVAIDNALEDYEFSNYTLFPGSENPALARNGLALEGTATLLIEQRYLEEMFEFTIGLEQDMSAVSSALALEAFLSMQGVAAVLTDRSLVNLDVAQALAIPERSAAIDFDDLYSDDIYGTELDLILV